MLNRLIILPTNRVILGFITFQIDGDTEFTRKLARVLQSAVIYSFPVPPTQVEGGGRPFKAELIL